MKLVWCGFRLVGGSRVVLPGGCENGLVLVGALFCVAWFAPPPVFLEILFLLGVPVPGLSGILGLLLLPPALPKFLGRGFCVCCLGCLLFI